MWHPETLNEATGIRGAHRPPHVHFEGGRDAHNTRCRPCVRAGRLSVKLPYKLGFWLPWGDDAIISQISASNSHGSRDASTHARTVDIWEGLCQGDAGRLQETLQLKRVGESTSFQGHTPVPCRSSRRTPAGNLHSKYAIAVLCLISRASRNAFGLANVKHVRCEHVSSGLNTFSAWPFETHMGLRDYGRRASA